MNKTLAIIKPEAVENGNIGAILKMIEEDGFKIIHLKKTTLSQEQAESFYEIHKEKAFFKNLIAYITSGPVVIAQLEKENAVVNFRTLIGATNPAEADENTIRKLYGTSKEKNAVHGSDSDENAAKEVNFFF